MDNTTFKKMARELRELEKVTLTTPDFSVIIRLDDAKEYYEVFLKMPDEPEKQIYLDERFTSAETIIRYMTVWVESVMGILGDLNK